MKGNKNPHTESVRAEKPQLQTSARTDTNNGEGLPLTEQPSMQMKERETQNSTPTQTENAQKETPLFCINNGRIPRNAFSPFEIAAEVMKIFCKKK